MDYALEKEVIVIDDCSTDRTTAFVRNLMKLGLVLSTIGIIILTYSGFRFRMPQVALELLFIVFALGEIVSRNGSKKISLLNSKGSKEMN